MVSVLRPPFWVPRPSDDFAWVGAPINSGAITVTRTQAKIYGQPGQAVTRKYAPLLTDNDPPMWQGVPVLSRAIVVTNTQAQIYGQHGQSPTKRWSPYMLGIDDPPTWWPPLEWLNSGAIIVTNTQAKIFGQHGQSPTKNWLPYYIFDDPPVWYTAPETFNASVLGQLNTGIPRSTFSLDVRMVTAVSYDDTPPWSPSSETLNALTLYISALRPKTQNRNWVYYSYDDAASWMPTPETQNAGILWQLNTGVPRSTFSLDQQRPYTYDDPPTWYPTPETLNASTLWQLNTGIPRATFALEVRNSLFTQDDPPAWQWPAYGVSVNLKPAGATPIVPRQPALYSEDAAWVGSARAAAIMPLAQFTQTGQVKPFRWNATLDDASSWQGVSSRSPAIFMLTVGGKPIAAWRPLWYSEDAFWQGTPTLTRNVLGIPPAPTTSRQQSTPPDDASVWTWSRTLSPVYALTVARIYGAGGQVPPFRPNFTSDDPPMWQGVPTRAEIVSLLSAVHVYGQGGQVPPFRWNATQDDPPPWQWPQYAVNQVSLKAPQPPLVHPPSQWFSEDAVWTGTPTRAEIISLLSFPRVYGKGGQAPPFRPNFTYDDPPMWQGAPVLSRAIVVTTSQARFYGQPGEALSRWWRFHYDDQSVWARTTYADVVLVLRTVPPPPRPAENVIYAKVRVTDYRSVSSVTSAGSKTAISMAASKTTVT